MSYLDIFLKIEAKITSNIKDSQSCSLPTSSETEVTYLKLNKKVVGEYGLTEVC